MVVVTAEAEGVTVAEEEATVVEAADTEEEVVDMVVRNLSASFSPIARANALRFWWIRRRWIWRWRVRRRRLFWRHVLTIT